MPIPIRGNTFWITLRTVRAKTKTFLPSTTPGPIATSAVRLQNEDPLKYAETYTAEESDMITITLKMIRLRSLYVDQTHQLQHKLREKRRQYVHSLKA